MSSKKLAKNPSFYRSIDQYGISPSLLISGHDNYKSLCGSNVSIFMILASVGMLYLSSVDFILKKNPNVSQSTQINRVIEEKTIGYKQDFNLAIGIFDEEFRPINDFNKYILVEVFSYDWFVPPSNRFTELDISPCTAETAPAPISEQINNSFCLPYTNQNMNSFVQSEDERLIYFRIKKCINNPPHITHCADPTSVNAKTKMLRLQVFYNELSVDLSNYDNPIAEIPTSIKFNAGQDLTRFLKVKLESVSVETDNGFFFPVNSEKSYTRIGESQFDIDPSQDGDLAKLVISNGNRVIKYQRSYKKYDLISAEVSGVIGVLTVILKIFIFPYFYNGYYSKLVKKYYDVSFEKKEKQKVNFVELIRRKKEVQNTENQPLEGEQQDQNICNEAYMINDQIVETIADQNQFEYLDEHYNIDMEKSATINPVAYNKKTNQSQSGGSSQNQRRQQQYSLPQQKNTSKDEKQRTKKSKLHMYFFEYATCLFLCKRSTKQKKKILDIGMSRIKKELDIVTILHKLKEIDKLKYCMMTHEQLILFNNLPKPKLNLESTDEEDDPLKLMYKKLFVELSEEAKQDYIEKTYEKIKNKKNKSELDQNILSSFEKAFNL